MYCWHVWPLHFVFRPNTVPLFGSRFLYFVARWSPLVSFMTTQNWWQWKTLKRNLSTYHRVVASWLWYPDDTWAVVPTCGRAPQQDCSHYLFFETAIRLDPKKNNKNFSCLENQGGLWRKNKRDAQICFLEASRSRPCRGKKFHSGFAWRLNSKVQ